ncbi:guanylate-binding protein 1-like [Mauremys mutica]|uniref:guanylate-binding protein 1-like n=1 Tax=Mauremys mutica TaxID=74926 RepID=UPI001D15F9D1|nr:guanylate-binding protein 1-like [Mauremys mutica]
MEQPVCLVANPADGELEVTEEALEALRGVDQPVVVVAVAGLYRTGKSYLLNQLAGRRTGFSLGSTIQSHTKGIWMWCLPHPHPRWAGHTLVLLDTEGLGDVEKGDTKNDAWIFALAVLLSSTLVYNSKGTIDQFAMEQLHFVSEISTRIRTKAQAEDGFEDDTQYSRFFPKFIWAVRDFTLELKLNGREVTEDDYLENALARRKGFTKEVTQHNLPRDCLRNYFPSRKCFVFVPPVAGEEMNRLCTLPDSALHPHFLAQAASFREHVLRESQVKTVPGGQPVTGRLFGALVQSYVGTIRSGQVPCLDNAVTAMAAMENEAALRAALAHYAAGMGGLRLPAELGELSAAHGTCEGDALRLFMQRSFKDEGYTYQKRLMEAMKESYGRLLGQNEAASKDSCRALLETLSAAMRKQLGDGVYSQPGGYELYLRDRNQVVEDFRKTPSKGVKAEEVLEQFLASKGSEAESVLNVDKKMTEAEKDLATQRQKAELLEQQRKAAEEKRLQTEQLMKDQERSHQENVKQLEAKMAEEAAHAKQEAERALQSKLTEQEAMLQQGFKEMAQMLGEEIAELRKEITRSKEQELLNTAKVLAKALTMAYEAWGRGDEDVPLPPGARPARDPGGGYNPGWQQRL